MKLLAPCLVAFTFALAPLAPAGGMKAGQGTAESQDAKAMFEVQSHLRTAEDSIARLKEDAAKPDPASRMGAEDRAAAIREVNKELATANSFLGMSKSKLDAPKVRDYEKRLAAARKDVAALTKPAAAPKPAKK
jgi:hypothetical protein